MFYISQLLCFCFFFFVWLAGLPIRSHPATFGRKQINFCAYIKLIDLNGRTADRSVRLRLLIVAAINKAAAQKAVQYYLHLGATHISSSSSSSRGNESRQNAAWPTICHDKRLTQARAEGCGGGRAYWRQREARVVGSTQVAPSAEAYQVHATHTRARAMWSYFFRFLSVEGERTQLCQMLCLIRNQLKRMQRISN